MRYKALPASVRAASSERSSPEPMRGVRGSNPIGRWTAILVLFALSSTMLLPIMLTQGATATISVTPTTTMAGVQIAVRGSAFAPRSRGVLHLDALSTADVTYRADGTGGFVVAFGIPELTAPGSHTVWASNWGAKKGQAALASASLVVSASATSPSPSGVATASVSTSVTPQPSPVPVSSATPLPTNPPGTPSPSPSGIGTGGASLRLPIRAAFYYPWFPEAWNQQGMDPFTHYHPSLGYYDGSSPAVIENQIAAMQYGNIAAGIASWWGIGTTTDQRIPALLHAAAGTGFRWSLYYEAEGVGNPSVAQITADLAYIAAHYATDPSYLRVGGRFVVFVYGDPGDSCATADRWRLANTVGAYVVLKVFAGYQTCASQPDGWHQYGPASATDAQAGYSFTISPGFFKANESTPRLARDLNRWYDDVRQMIASGFPFQLITTFNEWGEGTSVESATDWQTASGYGSYLDALHRNGIP